MTSAAQVTPSYIALSFRHLTRTPRLATDAFLAAWGATGRRRLVSYPGSLRRLDAHIGPCVRRAARFRAPLAHVHLLTPPRALRPRLVHFPGCSHTGGCDELWECSAGPAAAFCQSPPTARIRCRITRATLPHCQGLRYTVPRPGPAPTPCALPLLSGGDDEHLYGRSLGTAQLDTLLIKPTAASERFLKQQDDLPALWEVHRSTALYARLLL
jgi:hypothetical protein